MEQVGWILRALLIFLSLPSLPAEVTVSNTTEVYTNMAVSTAESIMVTTHTEEITQSPSLALMVTALEDVTDVDISMPNPTTEIITMVITATPEVTSVPEPITDDITTTKPRYETTPVQTLTSTVLVSTSEPKTREIQRSSTSLPVVYKGIVDTSVPPVTDTTILPNTNATIPPVTEPTSSPAVPPKTTTPYIQTTNQDSLTAGPIHTTFSLTEDSYLTTEPSHTTSGSSESPTKGLTHAPSPAFVTTPQIIPDHDTTPAVTQSSTSIAGGDVVQQRQPRLIWVIIVALLIGVIVVGLIYCICLLIRRKRRSHSEYLGSSFGPGKSSKRKKGAEHDAWAGPVKLGAGEEGVAGEEGGGPEDKRDGGGAEVVLSTFTANGKERNGPDEGVGMPGSKESKKWEEQEPLLYIDEGLDEELVSVSPEKHIDTGEGNGHQVRDSERVEQNGGAAFCITTAV